MWWPDVGPEVMGWASSMSFLSLISWLIFREIVIFSMLRLFKKKYMRLPSLCSLVFLQQGLLPPSAWCLRTKSCYWNMVFTLHVSPSYITHLETILCACGGGGVVHQIFCWRQTWQSREQKTQQTGLHVSHPGTIQNRRADCLVKKWQYAFSDSPQPGRHGHDHHIHSIAEESVNLPDHVVITQLNIFKCLLF